MNFRTDQQQTDSAYAIICLMKANAIIGHVAIQEAKL